MKSIRHIAQQYGGEVTIRTEGPLVCADRAYSAENRPYGHVGLAIRLKAAPLVFKILRSDIAVRRITGITALPMRRHQHRRHSPHLQPHLQPTRQPHRPPQHLQPYCPDYSQHHR